MKKTSEKVLILMENFRKKHINGLFFQTKEEAVAEIIKLIPAGSTVAMGGSVTVIESGLLEALRKHPVRLLDRHRSGITKEEVDEYRRLGQSADVLVSGSNAITLEGKLVNEDGTGNRIAGIAFGPKKVIVIAGINKLVHNTEEAIERIRKVAAPRNCIRLGYDTPCSRTRVCDDDNCFPPERICNQLLIIESGREPGRITVVLVNEELGF